MSHIFIVPHQKFVVKKKCVRVQDVLIAALSANSTVCLRIITNK